MIGTNHNVTSNYRRQLDVSTNLVTTSYTYVSFRGMLLRSVL